MTYKERMDLYRAEVEAADNRRKRILRDGKNQADLDWDLEEQVERATFNPDKY
jgi:hypothetical protein